MNIELIVRYKKVAGQCPDPIVKIMENIKFRKKSRGKHRSESFLRKTVFVKNPVRTPLNTNS